MKLQSPETAPKDGSQILVDLGYEKLYAAMYDQEIKRWSVALPMADTFDGIISAWYENDDYEKINGWMPMPEL